MRRLLLLVALLAVPSRAHADTPQTLALYGCALNGPCLQGIVQPVGIDRAVITYFCVSGCSDNTIVYAETDVFDANSNPIFSWRQGAIAAYWSSPLSGTDYANVDFKYVPPGGENGPTVRATAVITTTPEPVSMALVGTGLVVLGAVRRRRKLAVPEGV